MKHLIAFLFCLGLMGQGIPPSASPRPCTDANGANCFLRSNAAGNVTVGQPVAVPGGAVAGSINAKQVYVDGVAVGATGPIVLTPATVPSYPFLLDMSTANAASPDWKQGVQCYDVNPDTRKNCVFGFGWNMNVNGQIDPAEPATGIAIENYYHQGGIYASEFHITTWDLSGVEHRLMSSFMPRSGGAGSTTSFAADTFNWRKYDGTLSVQLSTVGNAWDFKGSAVLRFAGNYTYA